MATVADKTSSASDDTTSGSKKCPYCGRVFLKAAHLLRHTRSHDKQKPFPCTLCDRSFGRTDALQRHERTVHSVPHTVKRRRTDSSLTADPEEGDNSDAAQKVRTMVDPVMADSFATDDLTRSHNEQPDGCLISPSTAFADMSADGGESHRQPGLMAADSFFNTFPPPFLNSFPSSSAPINTNAVDDLVTEWLNQDGGALATENALAVVFSDQPHGGNMDIGALADYDFQSQYVPSHGVERPRSAGEMSSSSAESRHDRAVQQSFASHQHIPAAFEFDNPVSSSGYRSPPIFAGHRRRRGTVITADTWESGVSKAQSSEYTLSRPDSPQPSMIKSPDQVVDELHVNGLVTPATSQCPRPRESIIPSMKFLDACLHLYFRDFHPSFPVIHRPTFKRDRTSPLLLLSMCSIGCMFVGTQAARDNGLWIYERLHYVATVTRDSKMATESTRLAVLLSSVLGQCFSFLHGKPKQMLTAEFYHGDLCSMARRNGLCKKIKRNPISYEQVQDLDSDKLNKRWREWGLQETFRRASLGLTLHAAELTAYSGMARMTTTQVSKDDDYSDALFETNDAETWRAMLLDSERRAAAGGTPMGESALSETPEVFLPSVLLAQSIVNIHMLRDLENAPFGAGLQHQPLSQFYEYMASLAKDYGIETLAPSYQEGSVPHHKRCLRALWHYTCAQRLAPMDLIEEAAGRGGEPAHESIALVTNWVSTPAARLATLHCGKILHYAADLKDLGFILPRAIFQATLLLLSYLEFVHPPHGTHELVKVLQVTEWQRLAQLCDLVGGSGSASPELFQRRGEIGSTEELFIATGACTLHVKGLLEGKEKTLDIVSLRSTSNRLLRRCTPWGVGDTLGDILSSVSF